MCSGDWKHGQSFDRACHVFELGWVLISIFVDRCLSSKLCVKVWTELDWTVHYSADVLYIMKPFQFVRGQPLLDLDEYPRVYLYDLGTLCY